MEPDEVKQREFSSSLRGYDRNEVDLFAGEVAQQLRQLGNELASAKGALAAAKAAVLERPVESEPAPPSKPLDKDEAYRLLGEETSQVLIAAEKAAAEIRQKARNEAAEVLADARREAGRIEREMREGRQGAVDDLRKLRQTRGMLAGQLEDIRRKLAEAVARLQAPVDEAPAPPKPVILPPKLAARSGPAKPAARVETPKPASAPPESPRPAPPLETPKPASAPPESPRPAPPLETPKPASAPPVKAEETEKIAPAPKPASNGRSPVQPPKDAVDLLIEEIRIESGQVVPAPKAPEAPEAEPPSGPDTDMINVRAGALGQTPTEAARRLKRLLQEEQNDMLHRLRIAKGKGTLEDNIAPEQEQLGRFTAALEQLLSRSFVEGRKVGGAGGEGDGRNAVGELITKQVMGPLRREVSRVITAGLEAQDTPTAISERASDVFRVWKGVRTELVGQGLVYAAFHQGLLDAWGTKQKAAKRWVLAPEEDQCPDQVCESNATQRALAVGEGFSSGHTAPPAHGGCTCTLDLD